MNPDSQDRLPWRLIVVTDLGVDSDRMIPVTRAGMDSELRELGPGTDVVSPASLGAVGTFRFEPSSLASFGPRAVRDRLNEVVDRDIDPETLDAVLHESSFQRLESAYRGIDQLLDHTGGAVSVELDSIFWSSTLKSAS